MERLLLTANEVAIALGVSRRKVFSLIQNQEIESIKVGSLRRVHRDALHRYVDNLSHGDAA